MKSETDLAVRKLKKAWKRLQESTGEASDALDRDGVIKRFEFTFELFWKTLKILLEYEGFRCTGPRSCIKEAFRRDLLKEGETALDMLEDRNRTSHLYDEATAKEIFERIRSTYAGLIGDCIREFENYLSGE